MPDTTTPNDLPDAAPDEPQELSDDQLEDVAGGADPDPDGEWWWKENTGG